MEILIPVQKEAIRSLASSPLGKKFYWTGGTLLAYYYLHHRRSLDLDFFSEEKFSFEEINDWVQKFKKEAGFQKVSSQKIFDRWEFLFENKEKLRIEFVYYNKEKKRLRKRRKLWGIEIDSLEDLAANKVIAYFDRNEPKDLFDLYFLLTKAKLTPARLLDLARRKFGVELPEHLFWSEAFKALSLLPEIKPLMLEGSDRDKERLLGEIENYFKEKSERFLRKTLG